MASTAAFTSHLPLPPLQRTLPRWRAPGTLVTQPRRPVAHRRRAAWVAGLRPKQSLGQNFLRDGAVVGRIVSSFADIHASHGRGARVVEVGPGLGALTGQLLANFPDMHAIEIDQRAVTHLRETFPSLSVQHADVLDVSWGRVGTYGNDITTDDNQLPSQSQSKPESESPSVAVIGNLPYNIVSQILFALLEAPPGAVRFALVMMQREVAARIVAPPRTKDYGILSVVTQLYARPSILFDVDPRSFYPVPSITSSMVHLQCDPHPDFDTTDTTLTGSLRVVLKHAFGQRRKVLRNSLRTVCERQGVELPDKWEEKRAEELEPMEFVEMTQLLFKEDLKRQREVPVDADKPTTVWR